MTLMEKSYGLLRVPLGEKTISPIYNLDINPQTNKVGKKTVLC